MNTLVVYASQYGNTERVAQAIASMLREFGPAQAIRVDSTGPIDLAGVDVLIVASPTQAFRPMPAISAFLAHLSHQAPGHLSIACFDTRIRMPWPLNGTAAPEMARQLRRNGFALLLSPEGFFVKGTPGPLADGEVERATRWAESLYQAYKAAHPQMAVR